MSFFYVFQGETYNLEKIGEYIWSPQRDSSGKNNAGYSRMRDIHKGDYILHNVNRKLVAISIARSDCYEAEKPQELIEAKTSVNWAFDGYKVNCQYYILDHQLDMKNYKGWLKEHHTKESAFNINGNGKQQYLCYLSNEHAEHLLQELVKSESNRETLAILEDALRCLNDTDFEYTEKDNELLDIHIEDSISEQCLKWPGKREEQETTTSPNTGNEIAKRDLNKAGAALKRANYRCEYNPEDRIFLRKSQRPYTEPHHLIPISKYKEFDFSLDVMENIVSLCSHCHNLLHYGRFEDKKPILEKLYKERIEALVTCGIGLTIEQLFAYYK